MCIYVRVSATVSRHADSLPTCEVSSTSFDLHDRGPRFSLCIFVFVLGLDSPRYQREKQRGMDHSIQGVAISVSGSVSVRCLLCLPSFDAVFARQDEVEASLAEASFEDIFEKSVADAVNERLRGEGFRVPPSPLQPSSV